MKVDGGPVAAVVDHCATKCSSATKVLRVYRNGAPYEGSACVRRHVG